MEPEGLQSPERLYTERAAARRRPLDAPSEAWLYRSAVGGLRVRGLIIGVLAAAVSGSAQAGAWPMPKGEGQAITRYERQTAREAFDLDGKGQPIPSRWDDSSTVFVEYGLSDRLTFQGKLGYARGSDEFTGYEGASPAELGLRWRALRRGRTVVSVYGGAISPGEGENAVYVSRKPSDGELELRLLVGRSGRYLKLPVFMDVQLARMWRFGAADETRLDMTMGVELTRDWLILMQSYGGETDASNDGLRPGWVNSEVSAVRRLGSGWRGQLGWRTAVHGRDTTVGAGPVMAIWRKF